MTFPWLFRIPLGNLTFRLVQWVSGWRCLLYKPGNLSLSPRGHIKEGQSQLHEAVCWPPCECRPPRPHGLRNAEQEVTSRQVRGRRWRPSRSDRRLRISFSFPVAQTPEQNTFLYQASMISKNYYFKISGDNVNLDGLFFFLTEKN